MKKLIHVVWFSGIWLSSLLLLSAFVLYRYLGCPSMRPFDLVTIIVFLVVIPAGYITLCNSIRRQNGELPGDVKPLSFLKTDEYLGGTNKARYMNPPVDKRLLYKEPVGFCFGTWHGYYVCRPENTEGAILISGGSGTGKSSALIVNYILLCKKGEWEDA